MNPCKWEPIIPNIRASLDAGDDVTNLRAPESGDIFHRLRPAGGSVLDVMVFNANFYFETHADREWPEYLSIVEQLALRGTPLIGEISEESLEVHKDVKCLHAALAAGQIDTLRALNDPELNLTLLDILIRTFGFLVFESRKNVEFNPYMMTPQEEHYIDVFILLQDHGVIANMSPHAIMSKESFSDEDGRVVLHLGFDDTHEVRNTLMPRLAMIFLSGAHLQFEQAMTDEGVFVLHDVVKTLAGSGCLLDRNCFAFIREHGITSRTCKTALDDAIILLEESQLKTIRYLETTDGAFARACCQQERTRIEDALRMLECWTCKEARVSGFIQMTLQARPVPSDVAWVVDGFLFGLAPQGSVNSSPTAQTGETQDVLNPHAHHHPADVVDRAEVEEVIEVLSHADDEPAVAIDPEEASQVGAALWAGSVERLSNREESDTGIAHCQTSRIVLLTFGRHPKELEEAVEASGPAQVALSAGTNIKPAWANGAKILVKGLNPSQLEPPTVPDDGLKPYHVVVWDTDEESLLDGLKDLPYNIRKLNPGSRGRSFVPNEASLFSESASSADTPLSLAGASDDGGDDDDEDWVITVKSTFIHISVAPVDSRSTRSV